MERRGQRALLLAVEGCLELAVAGSVLRRGPPASPNRGEVEVGVGDVDPLPGQAVAIGAASGAGAVAAGPFVEPAARPASCWRTLASSAR